MVGIWKMAGAFIPACALMWAGVAGSATTAPPAVELTPEQQVQELVALIIKTVTELPSNTVTRQYEAQLALVLDRSQVQCATVVNAIEAARSGEFPPAAAAALANLQSAMAGCRTGTGAGPGQTQTDGNGGFAAVPNFSVGGGSDYSL